MVNNKILIQNATILPMTAGESDPVKYFTGNVAIEGNRIVSVSADHSWAKEWASQADVTLIDGEGKLLMPGLINTHTHVAMTLMRGYADDIPLMQWLEKKIWPFEAHLKGEDVYWGARLGIAEMLLSGTTSFLDMYMFERETGRAVEETGIRATLGPVVFDFSADTFFKGIKQELDNRPSCDRLSTVLCPHAPYTCSPETLRGIETLAEEYGLGIHIHVSETQDEIKQIRSRYNKTSVEYLEDLGILKHPVMAAHCVYLTENDREILLRNHTSILHNPQSNMKLASGAAPICEYLKMGINVSLGTDGTCSNNNLDMFDELRTAAFLQKLNTMDICAMPAYQVLQMATVNGAKALGKEGLIGVIKEGALADLILIDMDNPRFYPRFDLVAHLVYAAQGSDVDTVMVDGKILVRNHRLMNIDLNETCHEVETRAKRIVNEMAETNK